jgi:hypothetical protein
LRTAWCLLALAPSLVASPELASAEDAAAPAPCVATEGAPPPRNRPPKFTTVDVEPNNLDPETGKHNLRTGLAGRVTVGAEDPDGDRLIFSAESLPAGATLDADRGVLSWRPTREQEGSHTVVLHVTDGWLSAERRLKLVVKPNQAPLATGTRYTIVVARPAPEADAIPRPEDDVNPRSIAQDFDSDSVSFRVRQKPAGMQIEAVRNLVNFR